MTDHPIVLFDGVCVLCSRWVRFIINRDRKARFTFAALQSDTARRLLRGRGRPEDALDTIVLVDGDDVHTRSDAALEILSRLDGLWPMLSAGRYVPRPLRNWVYDLVARHRYRWFGSRGACMVPRTEDATRFLD